jgi:cullin-associated NEDD8-dissociated protein 1
MLIRDLLKELLPKLYNETRVRQDLIREVEMGPFKHTVDGKIYKKSFFCSFKSNKYFSYFIDGLDLRKAAYECMYTLLDSMLNF